MSEHRAPLSFITCIQRTLDLMLARLLSLIKTNNNNKTHSYLVSEKLYKSLVTTILLYGCETWTLLADSQKRIQAFEMK